MLLIFILFTWAEVNALCRSLKVALAQWQLEQETDDLGDKMVTLPSPFATTHTPPLAHRPSLAYTTHTPPLAHQPPLQPSWSPLHASSPAVFVQSMLHALHPMLLFALCSYESLCCVCFLLICLCALCSHASLYSCSLCTFCTLLCAYRSLCFVLTALAS